MFERIFLAKKGKKSSGIFYVYVWNNFQEKFEFFCFLSIKRVALEPDARYSYKTPNYTDRNKNIRLLYGWA